MKHGMIKLATLSGYLGLLLISIDFSWKELLDIKLLCLVMTGMICLSVPDLIQINSNKFRSSFFSIVPILGKNAVTSGILQAFLLFFSNSGAITGRVPYHIALCFRPLFYGYCFFVLFSPEKQEREETAPDPETQGILQMPEDSRQLLRDLGLTKRETELAELMLHGRSNAEIAETLVISEATVKKHVSNIFQKLGISRREQLLEVIMKKGG